MTISKSTQSQLESIAKEYFHVDTVETRNNDSLDFHEVAIWSINDALEAAFKLGQKTVDPKRISPDN